MKRTVPYKIGVILAILLLPALTPAHAQKDPIKWGKVPDEELSMKSYEPDTSAPALVLADYGNLYFDLSDGKLKFVRENHRRIKILKRSGFDYGDITIGFHKDGEKITAFKAHTITPDGETYDLDKSDVFEEKVTGLLLNAPAGETLRRAVDILVDVFERLAVRPCRCRM